MRSSLFGAILAIGGLLYGTQAAAHVSLRSASPAPGAEVATPSHVTLRFSGPIRVTSLTLQSDRSGVIKVGLPTSTATSTLSAKVPRLGPARYTVRWRGAGDDGHVMSGSWQFSVVATRASDRVAATTSEPQVDHSAHHGAGAPAATSQSAVPRVDGEIRKVDPAQRKLTVRHAPLTHLNMGAMTMVFAVAEHAWRDTLKVGDKVRIAVNRVEGVLTIVSLEPAPAAATSGPNP